MIKIMRLAGNAVFVHLYNCTLSVITSFQQYKHGSGLIMYSVISKIWVLCQILMEMAFTCINPFDLRGFDLLVNILNYLYFFSCLSVSSSIQKEITGISVYLSYLWVGR
jgi:hypothetical protein